MDRLTERIEKYNQCNDENCQLSYCDRCCEHYQNMINKLADYEDAEEQGLLLRLPCKVGDTVYTNISMQGWYMRKKDRPYKAKIVFIGVNGVDNFMNVEFEKGCMWSFKFSEIGKTVFLTREVAEQALAEMKGE